MDTRSTIAETLHTMSLDFQASDVFVKAKEGKLIPFIMEAEEQLTKLQNTPTESTEQNEALIFAIHQKLYIYYLFYDRNEAKTLAHAEKISLIDFNELQRELNGLADIDIVRLAEEKTTSLSRLQQEHMAEILNHIAHAKTIQASYKDGSVLKFAASIYANLLDQATPEDKSRYTHGLAFSLRYIALSAYRNFMPDNKPKNTPLNAPELQEHLALSIKAEQILLQAKSMIESLLPSNSLYYADLAEIHHLLGVVFNKRSINCTQEDEFFLINESKKQFALATSAWNQLHHHTKAVHPISMITMQSLADTTRRFGNLAKVQLQNPEAQAYFNESIEIAKKTLQLQMEFLDTVVHADLGKTFHYIGDSFLDLSSFLQATGEPESVVHPHLQSALANYSQSEDIKKQLCQPSDEILIKTQLAIAKINLSLGNQDKAVHKLAKVLKNLSAAQPLTNENERKRIDNDISSALVILKYFFDGNIDASQAHINLISQLHLCQLATIDQSNFDDNAKIVLSNLLDFQTGYSRSVDSSNVGYGAGSPRFQTQSQIHPETSSGPKVTLKP